MAGLVTAVVATTALVGSYLEQQDQNKSVRERAADNTRLATEQAALNQKMADVQNVRSARAAIRQQRAQAASIANSAQISGTVGASRTAGVLGGLSSGLAGDINYFGSMAGMQRQSNVLQLQQAQSDIAGAVSASESAARQAGWGAMGALATGYRTYKKG